LETAEIVPDIVVGEDETVLGFPFKDFESICELVNYLAQKSYSQFQGKECLCYVKETIMPRIYNERRPF
jgi:hypothetical protein